MPLRYMQIVSMPTLGGPTAAGLSIREHVPAWAGCLCCWRAGAAPCWGSASSSSANMSSLANPCLRYTAASRTNRSCSAASTQAYQVAASIARGDLDVQLQNATAQRRPAHTLAVHTLCCAQQGDLVLPYSSQRKEALLLPAVSPARATSSCLLRAAIPHPANSRTRATTELSPWPMSIEVQLQQNTGLLGPSKSEHFDPSPWLRSRITPGSACSLVPCCQPLLPSPSHVEAKQTSSSFWSSYNTQKTCGCSCRAAAHLLLGVDVQLATVHECTGSLRQAVQLLPRRQLCLCWRSAWLLACLATCTRNRAASSHTVYWST